MSFQYTSGDPSHLIGGGNASMADMQGPFTDLKTFLNARIAAIPTLVSALPAGPVDGQEIYYQADATNGIVWHLRYRSASGSTYKWELVGGTPMYDEVTTDQITASTTYVALTTAGPQITVPLAGDYRVRIGATVRNDTANQFAAMSYAIGATAAVDADMIQVVSLSANAKIVEARLRTKTALAASTALVARYRVSGGNGGFENRWMEVIPVRVG